MRKIVSFGMAVAMLVGCYDDPSDPKFWIKQLDDPREQKQAVKQLVKIHDEQHDDAGLEPLIALYKKNAKGDADLLGAIASFHDKRALPLMLDALDNFTEEAPDSASVAATSLGFIGDSSAVDALLKVMGRQFPVKSRANVVKLEAMKSLAKLKDPRAVDALIKVLSTSADDQDFYFNKIAAQALVEFHDPKAVPALVRGLWMTGRGAGIFNECRNALAAIGEPAVDKLVETMQRKNVDVEVDAKKYSFIPGIVVQKSAMVLGDIRSPKAVEPLIAELAKKDDGLAPGGVSGHQSVLLSLGEIGDPRAEKTLIAVLSDGKRHAKERMAAAEALNMLGDKAALPALWNAATHTRWLSGTTIDPVAAGVVATAITSYSRLADAAGAAKAQLPKIDPEIADLHEVVTQAADRFAVAKECKDDRACYEKYLADPSAAKAEKAAFTLARMGHDAVPALAKQLGNNVGDGVVRMAVLFALTRTANKNDSDMLKILDAQIALDKTKPPLRQLVEEMVTTRTVIAAR